VVTFGIGDGLKEAILLIRLYLQARDKIIMQMLSRIFSAGKVATVVTALCMGLASQAGATPTGVAAVSFPIPTNEATFTGAGTVGWSFNLDSAATVTYLGLFNTDLNADTTVALWDSSGTVLKSTVFDTNYTSVDMSDVGNSGFLWLSISNLSLGAGQYTLGAYSSADHFAAYTGNVAPTTASAGFHITSPSLVSFSPSLAKPTSTIVQNTYVDGFFGPNLRFDAPPPVTPIPATFWLLGSAVAGLAGISKRKKAA